MSRVQSRRTISVRSAVYDRLEDYADAFDLPVSQVVEHILRDITGPLPPTRAEKWKRWAERKGLL